VASDEFRRPVRPPQAYRRAGDLGSMTAQRVAAAWVSGWSRSREPGCATRWSNA